MPDQPNVTKAQLQRVKESKSNSLPAPYGTAISVQFNPQTLKINYANQSSGGDKAGKSAKQHIGKGTTKLSMDLWFDATVSGSTPGITRVDDVRQLTKNVIELLQPDPQNNNAPPLVQFVWGTFLFVGVVESINESLEFFSEDGKPLRASMGVSMASQDIQVRFKDAEKGPAATTTPGTKPRQQALAGETVPSMAAKAGQPPQNWPAIASANNLENARHIPAGTLLDLHGNVNGRELV